MIGFVLQNLIQQLHRRRRIALALSIERGDGDVYLHVVKFRTCGGEVGKDFQRPIKIELSHQPDAAILRLDQRGINGLRGRRGRAVTVLGSLAAAKQKQHSASEQ